MALIREASSSGYLGHSEPAFLNERDSALQAQMNHVAMWRHASRSLEEAGKTGGAAAREFCEHGDINTLVELSADEVVDAIEHGTVETVACAIDERRHVHRCLHPSITSGRADTIREKDRHAASCVDDL